MPRGDQSPRSGGAAPRGHTAYAGDGDAPALVNVAAIPNPTGPVKLAVVPMDGAGTEVQTLTMPRETYLALAAALVSCSTTSSEAGGSIEAAD